MSRAIALCLLAACAGPAANEKPGPRGYRADQHMHMAAHEAYRADQLTRWPDTRGADGSNVHQRLTAGIWVGTWDTAAEHERLAEVHRSAAAQLEAEYEQACGDAGLEQVSVSPLQRYGFGGNPVPNGMLVLLTPEAGPPDRLLKDMRCHRAWMMLGRTDMNDCPLDLPGIHVDARGDTKGIELTITVSDPSLVGELRRRAAHDLEAGHRRFTAH